MAITGVNNYYNSYSEYFAKAKESNAKDQNTSKPVQNDVEKKQEQEEIEKITKAGEKFVVTEINDVWEKG